MTKAQKALTIVCPLCKAGVGEQCISEAQLNDSFGVYRPGYKPRIKTPHRARIDKASQTS